MTQGCPCRRRGPADGLLLIVYSDLQRIEPQIRNAWATRKMTERSWVVNRRHKQECGGHGMKRCSSDATCRIRPVVQRFPAFSIASDFSVTHPAKIAMQNVPRSRDMPGCSRSQSSVRAQCRQIKGSLHLDVPSRYLNFSRGKDFQSRQVRYILLLDHVLAYSYSIRLPRSNRA